jgi:hypothetical protein
MLLALLTLFRERTKALLLLLNDRILLFNGRKYFYKLSRLTVYKAFRTH